MYSFNGVYIDTPEYETSGVLELDIAKKYINGNVNFTSGKKDFFQSLNLMLTFYGKKKKEMWVFYRKCTYENSEEKKVDKKKWRV